MDNDQNEKALLQEGKNHAKLPAGPKGHDPRPDWMKAWQDKQKRIEDFATQDKKEKSK